MPRRISAKRRAALINDLINADFDLTALHSKYALSPDSLSRWVRDEDNHRCLAGLCVLADLQTQLLLSRYRLIAAGKLFDLATNQPQDERAGLDISRRACIDLLKLDLKRADISPEYTVRNTDKDPASDVDSLRHLLYNASAENDTLALTATNCSAGAMDD
jgi:hypothetical protein